MVLRTVQFFLHRHRSAHFGNLLHRNILHFCTYTSPKDGVKLAQCTGNWNCTVHSLHCAVVGALCNMHSALHSICSAICSDKGSQRVGIAHIALCVSHYTMCTVQSMNTVCHYSVQSMNTLHSAICSDKGSRRVGIGGFTRLLPCNYTQLLSIYTA